MENTIIYYKDNAEIVDIRQYYSGYEIMVVVPPEYSDYHTHICYVNPKETVDYLELAEDASVTHVEKSPTALVNLQTRLELAEQQRDLYFTRLSEVKDENAALMEEISKLNERVQELEEELYDSEEPEDETDAEII